MIMIKEALGADNFHEAITLFLKNYAGKNTNEIEFLAVMQS